VPATAEDVARLDWIYHGQLSVGDLILGPAHEPHATKEEAEACFNAWRRAQPVALDHEWDNWLACLVCGAPTKKAARIRDVAGPSYYELCDEHLTEEHARSLITDIASAVYS
jgi:hypothetical protein